MTTRTPPRGFENPGQGIKKLIVSVAIVGAFAAYSVLHARSNAGVPPSGSGTTGSSPGTATATVSADATPVSGSNYRDGTFTGGEADAQWGYVQIQVVIQSGRIADVKFLEYPNDRNRSRLINEYADPQLVSEAIQAQSAQVDIVTGATDTSFAFMQSLDDALTKAQA
jgi:uncharacterized protein with FMN-binding domain